MAVPRFQWLPYAIEVPSGSPLVPLSRVKAVDAPRPGMTTIEVELPDLVRLRGADQKGRRAAEGRRRG